MHSWQSRPEGTALDKPKPIKYWSHGYHQADPWRTVLSCACTYGVRGTIRSRGVELELFGRFKSSWITGLPSRLRSSWIIESPSRLKSSWIIESPSRLKSSWIIESPSRLKSSWIIESSQVVSGQRVIWCCFESLIHIELSSSSHLEFVLDHRVILSCLVSLIHIELCRLIF